MTGSRARRAWTACSALRMVALALSLVLLGSAPTLAQAPDAEAEAKTLFTRGVEASDAGRWGEAADLYQRSLELMERPSTLFNLVGVLYRLGRYRDGLKVGIAYLRSPGVEGSSRGSPTASQSPLSGEKDKRTEVERMLADMELAVGVVEVVVLPRTAVLTLDGVHQPAASERHEFTVDPGRHTLTVEAPGHESHVERLVIERGARLKRELVLVPRSAQTAPPVAVVAVDEAKRAEPAPLDAPPPTKRQRRVRRALWATGSILVVGGLAAFMIAGAAKDEEKPEPTGGTTGITLPL